jgi:hypothetical protein
VPDTVDVALGAAGPGGSQLAAAQAAGIDVISGGQVILFRRYYRVVSPLDGMVFWVRDAVITPGAVPGFLGPNQQALNVGSIIADGPTRQVTPSSLHHTTLNQQSEDESFSLQKITLTAQQPVDFLTDIAPTVLWVGELNNLRFAFSQRTGFYINANTYHYRGDALYPSLATQLVEDPAELDLSLSVSNSLPIWLLIAQPGTFPAYPSYLVPDNIQPPYASVHIGEDDTTPIAAGAYHDQTSTRWQLARDRVRITFYGVRNDAAMDYLDAVTRYTRENPAVIGVKNTPIIKDAKRGQTEMSIIAIKKVAVFDVNYFQSRVRDVARQLILRALLTTILSPGGYVAEPISP